MPAAKGYLMILLSALCFGSYGVWCRLLGHHHFGVFYQGWVRSALILMVLLPLFLLQKKSNRIKRNDRKWFAITIIFTVFTQVPMYIAYTHLELGTAALIFYALFLITAYGIGWLFLSEKITTIKIISSLLALIGLFLTCGLSFSTFSITAMLFAAINGIASGGEVATSKKSTHAYSSLQLVTYSWLFIFITHLPCSMIAGETQWLPTLSIVWFGMVGYALSGLVGFWLIIEGFKYVDASIGSLIGLFEIPFSILFGVMFFDDALTIAILWGGLIILAAAILPDVYALTHRHAKPAPMPNPL